MGDAFLDAAFAARDLAVIEGLWRAWEPDLAVKIAPRITTLDEPTLTDLLLNEILSPSADSDPVAAAITKAVSSHSPSLTARGVEALVTPLLDETPLSGRYESRRASLRLVAPKLPL